MGDPQSIYSRRTALRHPLYGSGSHRPGLGKTRSPMIHDTAERPCCLCMPDGSIWRGTTTREVCRTPQNPSSSSSYEPDNAYSDRATWWRMPPKVRIQAAIEFRVDFPWTRIHGRAVASRTNREKSLYHGDEHRPGPSCTLLFEQAGFKPGGRRPWPAREPGRPVQKIIRLTLRLGSPG